MVTVYTVRIVTRTANPPATVTLPPSIVTNGVTSYATTITTTVPNGMSIIVAISETSLTLSSFVHDNVNFEL